MTETKLYHECAQIYNDLFIPKVPEKTGHMKDDASFFERIGKGEIELGINAKEAPYVVYTNEPWISPKWKGSKNPHEGWFDRVALAFAEELARRLGGELTIEKGDKSKWDSL